MELSGSKIKKFLISWEIELSSSKIKKVIIFSQKSFSYISGKGTFFKKLISQELSEREKLKEPIPIQVSYISGNGTF